MRIAVTGANGYVGSRIAAYLKKHATVVELTRKNGFVLGEKIDLRDIDVLMHCAYDFKDHEKNIKGSLDLFKAAKGKKIIFISSMSAFDGCKSQYGKAKLAVEKRAKGITIIRPGLVYDKNAESIIGKLRKVVKLPIVPLIGGNQKLYLVHSQDLGAVVWELANAPTPKKPIYAAHEQPHTFKEILTVLAGKKKFFIPVPYWVAYAGLRTLELLHLSNLRSDSLVGLMNVNPKVNFTQHIKTKFRPFERKALQR